MIENKAPENHNSMTSGAIPHRVRVRRIIGDLYNQHFNILLFLTLAFYILVTLGDIVARPPMVSLLFVVDGLVLGLLIVLFLLEKKGIVHTENVFLTPIPIAIAMLINGYTHVLVLQDSEMLVRGILMIVAFGIVSLLPWIFWFLLAVSLSLYIFVCFLMLENPSVMIGLGIGGAFLAYGAFAVRYKSVLTQIELTLEKEERANKLAQLGQAKDQFIANISHELRTPLTGLLGMVNLIEEEGLSKEQRDQLAAAKSSANTLGSIIKELLDISQLDAGKLELIHEPFDFGKTAESVVAAIQAQARNGVQLVYMPPEDTIPLVVGDASRLCQIFFNLTGNALKFTDSGSVKLQVQMLEHDDPVKLRCSVEDTGVGIPQEKLATLFDRFEQVDASSTRGRAGTGLGLAIAQELARLMGSEIYVKSELGQGSCFWFDLVLPRAPEEAQSSRQTINVSSDAVCNGALQRKILVAEDNHINRMLIKKLLDRPEWDVTMVEDGRAALEAGNAASYDIILMDIQMPHMSGEQVTAAIRSGEGLNRNTPIVALTANCYEEDIERYSEGGFSGFIGKPIAQADFYDTVEGLLTQSD